MKIAAKHVSSIFCKLNLLQLVLYQTAKLSVYLYVSIPVILYGIQNNANKIASQSEIEKTLSNYFILTVSGKKLSPFNAKILMNKFVSAIQLVQAPDIKAWQENQHSKLEKITKNKILTHQTNTLLDKQLKVLSYHKKMVSEALSNTPNINTWHINAKSILNQDNLLGVSLAQSRSLMEHNVSFTELQLQKQDQKQLLKTKMLTLSQQQKSLNLELESFSPSKAVMQVIFIKNKKRNKVYWGISIFISLMLALMAIFFTEMVTSAMNRKAENSS